MSEYRNCEEVSIPLSSNKSLQIFIEDESEQNTLIEVSTQDAVNNGEQIFQLLEGKTYEYELPKGYKLKTISGIVKPSRRVNNQHRGRIVTGIYVGRLPFTVISPDNDTFEIAVEVRSIKADYRSEYRTMLEDITTECTELLMLHSAAVTQQFSIDYEGNSQTLYQRFSFVKSIVDSDNFHNAVHRVIAMPVTAWAKHYQETDVRRIKRVSPAQTRQIASRGDRIALPNNHPISNKISSVPSRLTTQIKIDSVDNPENRFVKHVLNEFYLFCGRICIHIEKKQKNNTKYPNLYHEAQALQERLSEYLNHNIFREVGIATTLPLNSPVLQRQEGYREILRIWLMYELASKLVWNAFDDDAYHAGKRDIATIYEYWVFFKLLRLIENVCSINAKSIADLIKPTNDGLGLQLKTGSHTAIEGRVSRNGRNLHVKFNYNKTFGHTHFPKSGSWAQPMRPDYTLSFWPSDFTEKQAEEQELIIHVHFDAKYKVEGLEYLISDETDNLTEDEIQNILSEEKLQNKKGTYKRADILKMHAYKDAIRRTVGAYVLYPGTKHHKYRGFHEIVPGLGAFPMSPSSNYDGSESITRFIDEVIENYCNRASQRERMAFHKYNIHKSDSDDIHEMLPEYMANTKTRTPPPSEETVLIGYYNQTQFDWINKSCLYNIRIDTKNGLTKYGPKEMGAKYLLLHTKNKLITSMLWRITSTPQLKSRQDLLQLDYPTIPSCEYYLVYEIKPVDLALWGNCKWDVRSIKGFKTGRASSIPFSATLSDFTKAAI